MQLSAEVDAIDLAQIRRVLVIKLRHHGDVLLASPVFTVLKRSIPHAEVDALVYRETAPMLAGHPAIGVLHTIDRDLKRRGILTQLRGEIGLLRGLVARHYDLIVHLTEHPRGAWLRYVCGARHAVARARDDAGWWWNVSFTHRCVLPQATERHVVEQNLDFLRRLGIWPNEDEKRLVLVPNSEARARVAKLLSANGLAPRSFILVHPGSRWLFKCWPAASTAAMLDRLGADRWPLVLTGSPDAQEEVLLAKIREASHAPLIDLAGKLSLTELAAIIDAARLVVTVDSAPMHIAAAMGTPVVALFGPSGEYAWGPWRVPHRVVASTGHPCRPCGINGCGGSNHSACLIALPEERVSAAVTDLLAATSGR